MPEAGRRLKGFSFDHPFLSGLNRFMRALESRIILGIDPGSLRTGFAVVHFDGECLRHLNHGVIVLNESTLGGRLFGLSEQMREILERYEPHHVVIEKIFLGKSADSAFKLGHARGITMAEAARSGAEIVEYATRVVKKGIAGTGAASKEQVSGALSRILGLKRLVNLDASDALALAVYHSFRWTEAVRRSALREL